MRSVPLRASLGSQFLLGTVDIRMDALPTTLYFMVGERCRSNCAYCAQARGNKEGDYLSRVLWPPITLDKIEKNIDKAKKKGAGRICLQTLDYTSLMDDLRILIPELSRHMPLSASVPPLKRNEIEELKELGMEMGAISLDLAREDLFEKYRGKGVGNSYSWEGMMKAIDYSSGILPTVTHIIIGLGENDMDLLKIFLKLKKKDVYPALFAYTPVRPSPLLEGITPPPPGRYRAVQLMHYHIFHLDGRREEITFNKEKIESFHSSKLLKAAQGGVPFVTNGCPGCNRPFYNESPRGPMYNYPYPPDRKEVENSLFQLNAYGVRLYE